MYGSWGLKHEPLDQTNASLVLEQGLRSDTEVCLTPEQLWITLRDPNADAQRVWTCKLNPDYLLSKPSCCARVHFDRRGFAFPWKMLMLCVKHWTKPYWLCRRGHQHFTKIYRDFCFLFRNVHPTKNVFIMLYYHQILHAIFVSPCFLSVSRVFVFWSELMLLGFWVKKHYLWIIVAHKLRCIGSERRGLRSIRSKEKHRNGANWQKTSRQKDWTAYNMV